MGDLLLEVLSHHGQILKEDLVEMVQLPTVSGPVTILRNHAPYYATLDIGILTYRVNGQEEQVALGTHGLAEVFMNHVSVFCHTAERADSIDVERALRAEEKALALMEAGVSFSEGGLPPAIVLKKARLRLKLAKKHQER